MPDHRHGRANDRSSIGEGFPHKASCGVSQLCRSDQKLDDVIQRADAALYHAKATGRDRTVVYEELRSAPAADLQADSVRQIEVAPMHSV
ncbi:MAG: diguanylate cyclase [Planctomycetes bacterium]|nr:diguanylate cyclase [Planctomycetota bacterium]